MTRVRCALKARKFDSFVIFVYRKTSFDQIQSVCLWKPPLERCRSTRLGTWWSTDWPFHLRETVETTAVLPTIFLREFPTESSAFPHGCKPKPTFNRGQRRRGIVYQSATEKARSGTFLVANDSAAFETIANQFVFGRLAFAWTSS